MNKPISHRKRHGQHQKRTSRFLNTYHPFLPLLLIITGLSLVASAISYKASPKTPEAPTFSQPAVRQVLAFATNISSNGLLDYTNQRRSAASLASLSSNSQLTQAAQAKANDMANRNYWSHNTPEGSPPWTFITNAGYSYSKAGENLACGFDKSQDVITGWYNSPSHQDNLLHKDYTQVGFGIANSNDYNCGALAATSQTIIVAMYGTPYVKSAATSAPASTPATTKKSAVVAPVKTEAPIAAGSVTSHNVAITVTDTAGKPAKGIKVTINSEPKTGYTDDKGLVTLKDVPTGKHTLTLEIEGAKTVSDIDLTNMSKDYKLTVIKPELASNAVSLDSDKSGKPVEPKKVNRLDLLTNGNTPWILGFLMGTAILGLVYMFVKHSLAAHKFIVKGERYILTHKLVDVLVILLCIAIYMLTRSVGNIL